MLHGSAPCGDIVAGARTLSNPCGPLASNIELDQWGISPFALHICAGRTGIHTGWDEFNTSTEKNI
jgi:hypothetical protein